jgi:VanZ family protein
MCSARWPWAPVAVAGAIMLGAALPGPAVGAVSAGSGLPRTLFEDAAHVGQFLVFAAVTWRATPSVWSIGRAVGLTAAAVTLLALGSELVQLAVPGRMFDTLDLALDGIGGLSGLVLASGAGARGP